MQVGEVGGRQSATAPPLALDCVLRKRPYSIIERQSPPDSSSSWQPEVIEYLHRLYTGDSGDEPSSASAALKSALASTCRRTLASLGVPPLETTLRANLLHTSRADLITRLQQAGIGALRCAQSLPSLLGRRLPTNGFDC